MKRKNKFQLKKNNIAEISCVHTKLGLRIRKVTIIAIITSLSFVINIFGIPFFWVIEETEKIEFGLIISFALIGIIQLSWLMIVVLILPLLDQLIHSHFLPSLPLDVIFNFLVFCWFAFWFKIIFIKPQHKNNLFGWLFLICISLSGIVLLKFFYLKALIFLIHPEIEVAKLFPTFFATIFKFSVILLFVNIIKVNINWNKLIQI